MAAILDRDRKIAGLMAFLGGSIGSQIDKKARQPTLALIYSGLRAIAELLLH